MNPTGLWQINANIQVVTALLLVVLLLFYIAYRFFSKGISKPSKSSH